MLIASCAACVYLPLMLLHEGKLVLQLLQHLHLGGLELYSVGPQVIQVLHISQKCCMNTTAYKQLLHICISLCKKTRIIASWF